MDLGGIASLLGQAGSEIVGLARRIGGNAEDAVAHPVRRRIAERVRTHPGENLQQLCEALELNRGTATYHAWILERSNVLQSHKFGRERRFFPEDFDREECEQWAALRAGRAGELAAVVLDHPGLIQKDLTGRLGIDRKVARGYLRLLDDAGLLDVAKEGNRRRYFPTGALRRFADAVRRWLRDD